MDKIKLQRAKQLEQEIDELTVFIEHRSGRQSNALIMQSYPASSSDAKPSAYLALHANPTLLANIMKVLKDRLAELTAEFAAL